MQAVSPLALHPSGFYYRSEKYLHAHAQAENLPVVRKYAALDPRISQFQHRRCHIIRPHHKAWQHLFQNAIRPRIPLLQLLQSLSNRVEKDCLALLALHERLTILHAVPHGQQFLAGVGIGIHKPKAERSVAFLLDSRN